MIGSSQIPEEFPERLVSSVEVVDGITLSFDSSFGFSPLRSINQTFTSPECINENRPVFQPRNATVYVYEDTVPGSVIAVVFANDSDALENAVVTYAFHDASQVIKDTFSINETSGEVTLKVALNRESLHFYQIGLTAEDMGNVNTNVGYGSLSVHVLDVNDNDPVFDPVVAPSPVPEDTPLHTPIFTVHATDADVGENSTITYTIISPPNVFSINNVTGVISVAQKLNYESSTSYDLVIEARDGGPAPGRFAVVNVTVLIAPINEHPPSCDPIERIAVVAEDELVGTQFYTFTVSDDDIGSNHSTLSFSVSHQAEFGVTKISDTSASLYTLSSDFNRGLTQYYLVTVTVTDGGSLTCDLNITIAVGEPSRTDIRLVGPGHVIGIPSRVDGGHSQNFTFLVGDVASTRVYASLGGVNESVVIEKVREAPTHFNTFLYQSIVYKDDPSLSALTLQFDSSFNWNNIDTKNVSLSIQPAANDDVSAVSSEFSCLMTSIGLCESTATVPSDWFDQYDEINVTSTVEGLESKLIGVVSLRGDPTISPSPDNLYLKLPYGPVAPRSNFTVSLSGLFSTSVSALQLEIDVSSDLTLVSLSLDNWVCEHETKSGILSLLCIRYNLTPDTATQYGTSLIGELTFSVVASNNAAIVLTGRVKSLASLYGTLSYEKPIGFIDRDTVSYYNGTVYVETPSLVSLFSLTAGEIVNYAPFGMSDSQPLRVYGLYDDRTFSILPSSTISCISDNVYVAFAGSCVSIDLTPEQTQGSHQTEIEIRHTETQLTYTQSLRVWYPDSIRLSISDRELNRIQYSGCGTDNVYQSSEVSVYARFSTGVETSPEVRIYGVTSLRSDNGAVANFNDDYSRLLGKGSGTANIRIIGLSSTSVPVTVTNEVVRPYQIYPTIFTSLSIVTDSNTFSSDSVIRATASHSDSGLNRLYETATVSAYMYFTDGARLDLPSLNITSTSSAISVTEDNQFRTINKGSAKLTVNWTPSSCSSGTVSTTESFSIESPDLSSLEIIVTSSRLTPNSTLNIQQSTAYTVMATFSDDTTLDVTDTSSIQVTTGPVSVDTDAKTITALDSSFETLATVTASFTDGTSTVSDTVNITVVWMVAIEAHVYHTPVESPVLTKNITLRQIEDTDVWEEGRIVVRVDLSDGTSEDDVSGWVYSMAPAGIYIDLTTGLIRVYDVNNVLFGETVITVLLPGQLQDAVSVTISNESASILSLSLSLSDEDTSNDRTITIGADLSDGVNLTSISPDPFTFTVSPDSIADINDNKLTVRGNHYTSCTLTASRGNTSTSTSFTANIQPDSVGQLDIGNEEGVPQIPVTEGNSFTTEIRVNREGRSLSAFEISLAYDPDIIRVTSVSQSIRAFSVHRMRSPRGVIKLLSSSIGPTEQVPVIASITWEAIDEGETSIDVTDYILLDENIADFSTNAFSLPISIIPVPVGKRSIVKRASHGDSFGDINDDHAVDVRDVLNMTYSLIGRIPSTGRDINFDTVSNVYDLLYLIRATTGLVPFLTALPSVTPVSEDNNCLLTLSATIQPTSPSSVYVFFLVSDNATSFNTIVNVTEAMVGYESGVFSYTGIYEGTSTDNATYTASLLTPISYIQGSVGLSVFLVTADELSSTSPLRTASFTGSPSAVVSSQKPNQFNLSSNEGITLNNVNLGQSDGLYSLHSFTNYLRSDYCQFNGSTITVPDHLPEDYPLNETFFSVTAVQTGFTTDGDVNYSLQTTGSPFVIADPSLGNLQLTESLDYDSGVTSYNLIITATIPALGASSMLTATVSVLISDVNDNAPTFEETNYVVFVSEARPVDTIIVNVSAYDNDTTLANNQFNYSITAESNFNSSFVIDPLSGVITLAKSLDREQRSVHELIVLATDNGASPMTGTTTVTVMVEDINDNSPVFHHSPYTFYIPEDIYNDTDGLVLVTSHFINVTDRDFGDNGTVSLELYPSNTFDISDDGYIIVNEELDRETVPSYNLIINATDNGTIPRSTTASLTIIITDVNDNHPSFIPSQREFLLEDDLSIGTTISTINATDADAGSNKVIEYSVMENGQPSFYFGIDPMTGRLFINQKLVVENGMSRKVQVIATDKGVPPLSNSTDVSITVIEGQVIEFGASGKGFVLDRPVRDSPSSYQQEVGYTFGEELGTSVRVSGRVGTAFSRDFENADLSNIGGPAVFLRGNLVQSQVAHTARYVTAILRAYDSRNTTAAPTLLRIQVIPFASLASLSNTNPIGYCTTNILGYCVARVSLPDAWFQRSSMTNGDRVSIYINTASSNENGVLIGSLAVEGSPVYLSSFLSSDNTELVPPSHTVYTNDSFFVSVYVKSPLHETNYYTAISTDVITTVGIDGYSFGPSFSCGKYPLLY